MSVGDTARRDDGETIGSVLAEVAARQPDAVALSDGASGQVTFAELSRRTRRAARWLCEQHPDGDAPVALLVAQEAASVVVELSVIAAGRAAMPLDPAHPDPHLRELVAIADPVAIVCRPQDAERARGLADGRPVHVWEGVPDGPDGPDPVVDPADAAFVLFTAGSTGSPKAIPLDHRAFVPAAHELAEHGYFGPGDRIASVAPLAYAGSAAQLTWLLLAGAEACTYPLRERGPRAFVEWMRTHSVTGFTCVTSLARAVAALVGETPLPDLRLVLIGGEAIRPSDIPLLRSIGGGPVSVGTVMASTEMMLVAHELFGPEVDTASLGSTLTIGTPRRGLELDLVPLDAHDAADGVGELVITAPIHTRGYLGRADLTAEAFRFDEAGGTMTFRSGDVGRRGPGGISLLGRTDDLVKVRGQRVELSAVEAALRAAPDVEVAGAVAVPRGDDVALVGHVSGAAGGPRPDAGRVRDQLRRNLPAYLVPQRIVVHDAVPALASGKIDRRTLLDWSVELAPLGREAASDTERRLLKFLREHLGIDGALPDVDLFDQGVDSLLAVELFVFAEQEFGVALPLSTWLELTTVEQIAAFVEAGGWAGDTSVVQIQRGDPGRAHVVFASDLHGSAFRFRDLAAAMGTDLTALGLDSPFLSGLPDRPRTIEDIARIHVDDLLADGSDRVHHLVGYSFGAILVVEMARQLSQRGARVGFLGLLDFGPVHCRHPFRRRDAGKPLGAWPERAPSDRSLGERIRFHVERTRAAERGDRLRYLSRVANVAAPYDRLAAEIDIRRSGQVRPSRRAAHCWYSSMDAAVRYAFPPLDHDATLFLSDQTAKGKIDVSSRLDYASLIDPMVGWGEVVRGRLEVVPVVGFHNDLVEPPYVVGVGAAIRAALDTWLEEQATPDVQATAAAQGAGERRSGAGGAGHEE